MGRANVEAAATALRDARLQGVAVEPVAKRFGLSGAAVAYAVQDLNTATALDEGRRIVGRKVGLTSKAVQVQLGVDRPDFGMLFGDMGYLDGDVVPFDRLIQPRAEAEVAFVLERDLNREGLSFLDVQRAVEFALPAIEIVDSAIADWQITFEDTVADNASSGLFVLGRTPVSLAGLDLELAGMVMQINGQVASSGVGAACLGHPLQAVLWLAKTMVEVGRPLLAGDIVMSGALGPMSPLQAGDACEARIAGLGGVGFRLG